MAWIRHRNDEQRVLSFHHWMFRKELWTEGRPKKVVFWRPTFNREIPSGGKKWKMTFSVKEWERIIHFLELKGYEMVELTYRTPVSEASTIYAHPSSVSSMTVCGSTSHVTLRNL